jgi:hypothetical protein
MNFMVSAVPAAVVKLHAADHAPGPFAFFARARQ